MHRDQPSECLKYLLNDRAAPSPCFVLDAERLRLNMALLSEVQNRTGARVLLALKAFAAWGLFPLLSKEGSGPLWGVCASSVDEALLGKEKFGGEVHAYAPAWTKEEMLELRGIADHISFNSIAQWQKFAPLILPSSQSDGKFRPIRAGLRVNPECSAGGPAIYDPCSPGSRLGVRAKDMPPPASLKGIDGLHFHALCEKDSPDLARVLCAFEEKFSPWLGGASWLNFGGGHHITRDGYDVDLLCSLLNAWKAKYKKQIYLEPGEAAALDAGWLLADVLDIVEADMPVLILNVSAACHMPDVLEMPYTPDLWHKERAGGLIKRADKPGMNKFTCRAAGKSCLAGDIIGEYSFSEMPRIGDRLAFGDMAIYSMVKATTFNGLRPPSIAAHDFRKKEPFKVLRAFGYEDFKGRLS